MNHKLDTDTQVFFYEQEFYPLSNFSSFQVEWKGIVFPTSEHAYHWEKFVNYPHLQEMILQCRSAHDAFESAQKLKSFVRDNWDESKYSIMRHILWEKCKQHKYVYKKLMETGTRELIEDSWRDDQWGWGPDKNGQNLLGKVWMEIRKSIIDHEQEFGRNIFLWNSP